MGEDEALKAQGGENNVVMERHLLIAKHEMSVTIAIPHPFSSSYHYHLL